MNYVSERRKIVESGKIEYQYQQDKENFRIIGIILIHLNNLFRYSKYIL